MGFFQISRKVKGLELMFVHNAYINLHIAVIFHLFLSLYNAQEPRYDFSDFARWAWSFEAENRKNSDVSLSPAIFVLGIKISIHAKIQHS